MATSSDRISGVDSSTNQIDFVSVSESQEYVTVEDAKKVDFTEKLTKVVDPSKQLSNALGSDEVKDKLNTYAKDAGMFKYISSSEQNDLIASMQTSIKDKTLVYGGTLDERSMVERLLFNCPVGDDSGKKIIDDSWFRSIFDDYVCGSDPYSYLLAKAKATLGLDVAPGVMDSVMDAANSTNGKNFLKDLDTNFDTENAGAYITGLVDKTAEVVNNIDATSVDDKAGLYGNIESIYTKAGKALDGDVADLDGICKDDTITELAGSAAMSKPISISLTGEQTTTPSTAAILASL